MTDKRLDKTAPMRPDWTRLQQEPMSHEGRTSLLIYHRDQTRVLTLVEGQQLIVGRDPDAADVHFGDEKLSRQHARFEVEGGDVFVEDLGSTNGTLLNGERVQRVRMRVHDEAVMGPVIASIHVLSPLTAAAPGRPEGHDGFVGLVEQEVIRGRAFGRGAAVLMLGLPRGEAPTQALPRVLELLREVDRVGLYSEQTVEVLAPELAQEQALQLGRELVRSLGPGATCGVCLYPDAGASADELLAASRRALRGASSEQPVRLAAPRALAEPGGDVVEAHGPVIESAAMRELYGTIERLAGTVIPVLIVGETGTGKELLARAIHECDHRGAARMAAINCGAIPANLVESVLFGHERGAFTGASQQSAGLFEQAHGGSVLLDEVGELSASAQAALLRVLETRRITRVGSTTEVDVDVRVIAATHRDLEQMCQAGEFRSDLFYRLETMTLTVPPLRQRPEEIAPLAERFVRHAAEEAGFAVTGIDAEAMRLLHAYPWPGNIRELRNAIERAVVICRGDRVGVEDLPRRIQEIAGETGAPEQRPAGPSSSPAPGPDGGDLRTMVAAYEAELIVQALRAADWSRAEAARLLQIPVRTLSHKIKQHGIKMLGYGVGDGASSA